MPVRVPPGLRDTHPAKLPLASGSCVLSGVLLVPRSKIQPKIVYAASEEGLASLRSSMKYMHMALSIRLGESILELFIRHQSANSETLWWYRRIVGSLTFKALRILSGGKARRMASAGDSPPSPTFACTAAPRFLFGRRVLAKDDVIKEVGDGRELLVEEDEVVIIIPGAVSLLHWAAPASAGIGGMSAPDSSGIKTLTKNLW
jgi:hypothetical protein